MRISILSNDFRYFFGLHPSSLDSFIPLSLCGCSLAEQGLERVETYFCFTPTVTFLAYFSPVTVENNFSLYKMSNLRFCKREKCKLTSEMVTGFFF